MRLDAAAPDQVYLERAFTLAVAVRQPDSLILEEDDLLRVKSGPAQLFWPESAAYVELKVKITAAECEIPGVDSHIFLLAAGHDSPIFYFQLVPKRLGKITIIVTLYQDNDYLGNVIGTDGIEGKFWLHSIFFKH